MMQLDRRTVLAGSLLALAACAGRPDAATVWRLGTNLPATHPLSARMKEAADRIYTASGQRLLIEVYPAGQLGSDADMLIQLRGGAIHVQAISELIMPILVPVTAIGRIGFASTAHDQLFAAMDGTLGEVIKSGLAARGLIATPKVFESGFRQITTRTRQIDGPADLVTMMAAVPGGAIGFMAVSIAMFIVPGSILEGIPAFVLLGPLLFPVARGLGIHDVHYAMVVILTMGIGLFSPPFGVGYYSACAIGKVDPDRGLTKIWPYVAGLALVAAIPWISVGFLTEHKT